MSSIRLMSRFSLACRLRSISEIFCNSSICFLASCNLLLALGDHAVVAFRVGLIPNAFHQDHLHFLLQQENVLLQFTYFGTGRGSLRRPSLNEPFHPRPVFLIHFLCSQDLRADPICPMFPRPPCEMSSVPCHTDGRCRRHRRPVPRFSA